MKEIFSKHWVAVLTLVLAALLVVPVSGGIGLSKKYEKAFSSFDKRASKSDKYGNSLINDLNAAVSCAEACLSAAEKELGADDRLIIAANAAIKHYKGQKAAHERYAAYTQVCDSVERAYNAASRAHGAGSNAELEAAHVELVSYEDVIKKTYSEDYNVALASANGLLTGFPAEYLAKLYGIGE